MAQELSQRQTLTQTQTQTLAPQQLLVVKLLELPVSDLENRVRNELMENSALEEDTQSEDDTYEENFEENSNAESSESDTTDFESDNNYEATDPYITDQRADYASDDDTPDYLLGDYSNVGEQKTFLLGESESFYDKLIMQLGEYDLTEKQHEIMEYLIGSLDSDGLLRKEINTISDELAIYHNVDATAEEITTCLTMLQTFEPCGIAARSLQECLLLQLKDSDYHSDFRALEIQILERNFDDFTHKRIERLQERYNLEDEQIRKIYSELARLNPRPGSAMSDNAGQNMQQIIPDFIVSQQEDGEFEIHLNCGDVPQLHVSRSYRELLNDYSNKLKTLSREQKNTYLYSKQKVDAAQNFINAIRQRQDTLMRTMRVIVEIQTPFFEDGDETLLRPMILKDVASRTGLDVSTISRVSNSKYVQTDFGVYPLKYFFNDTFVTKDGEELSKIKIKNKLKELIDSEDKANPLSDDLLAKLLKEAGYAVARRTVAKYREMLSIPVARLRK